MNICILGLGYVGVVSSACFAELGHNVIGVDINKNKVNMINNGKSPIIEDKLENIISITVKNKKLQATINTKEAIDKSNIIFICVGTPSQFNGDIDLKYVRRVCEEIGLALVERNDYPIVVVRSTMLPGSMNSIVIPTLETYSKKKCGLNIGISINPEFLREGSAIEDFYNPSKIVIGENDEKTGDILVELYNDFKCDLERVEIPIAEMIKYIDNSWHALKVCFSNEIGNICKELNIDSHKAMEIFCKDKKLNLSSNYLKPGFAFGGSCLPKDLRALCYKANRLDLKLPILNSILRSNEIQIDKVLNIILNFNKKKIAVLGFSFKEGTDDLRESPIVSLIESLIGKGYNLKLYDKNVNISKVIGGNRDYIINKIPHISDIMEDDMACAINHAEIIIIGNKEKEFKDAIPFMNKNKIIIDLVRITNNHINNNNYYGICW